LAKQHDIGKLGEAAAVTYIERLGYQVQERNWRFSKAEIDIIAFDGEVLVFVEVKAKSYTHFGEPSDSISAYKENLIFDAANQYMKAINHEWEIRFDIISVLFDKDKNPTIAHYKDAFFPGI
jgi:putative endonuclease